jgi:alpha-beta hydrolase superfamily lysophospholipase
VYGSLGAVLALLVVFIVHLNGRQDLHVWHTAGLDEEYTGHSGVTSFDRYLDLEKRLFQQLDQQVYAKTGRSESAGINRYQSGSLADPERWSPNWNRSYLMDVEEPRASVLLLHGLSDAPYSLRRMAMRLHESGATVLGLRIPGHGTAPSALTTVTWQDMAAAVRLGARHLAEKNPGLPIYIVGYSNGAALAVEYVLETLVDPGLPTVGRLVLVSPEIGVAPAAALAVWQARLGQLLGLEKLAWHSIQLEYDPFKYGSFAVNAGDVSHQITRKIQGLLQRLSNEGRLEGIPPMLAFSSVVDATVDVTALVGELFNRLPQGSHELVLFDINRRADVGDLLRWKPDAIIDTLRAVSRRNYTLSLVTNRDPGSQQVIERKWQPGKDESVDRNLGMSWPPGVYSLSHVALPFAPDDPLYGNGSGKESPGIQLGNLALRGERGALAIGDSAQIRQRWNPFYAYLEDKSLGFLQLGRR